MRTGWGKGGVLHIEGLAVQNAPRQKGNGGKDLKEVPVAVVEEFKEEEPKFERHLRSW